MAGIQESDKVRTIFDADNTRLDINKKFASPTLHDLLRARGQLHPLQVGSQQASPSHQSPAARLEMHDCWSRVAALGGLPASRCSWTISCSIGVQIFLFFPGALAGHGVGPFRKAGETAPYVDQPAVRRRKRGNKVVAKLALAGVQCSATPSMDRIADSLSSISSSLLKNPGLVSFIIPKVQSSLC